MFADTLLTFSHPKQEFKLLGERFTEMEYLVRYSGIMGQVYVEEQVEKIFFKRLKNEKNKKCLSDWFKYSSFKKVIELLLVEGIIRDSQFKLLKKISEVRNKCAHLTWVGATTYKGKNLMNETVLKEFQQDVIKVFEELKSIADK